MLMYFVISQFYEYLNPVVPGIFNKPGLPGGVNLPHLLFWFVFTAARSADVLFQTKLSIDLDSKDAGVRIIFLIRLGWQGLTANPSWQLEDDIFLLIYMGLSASWGKRNRI